jgi:hypothetical protein
LACFRLRCALFAIVLLIPAAALAQKVTVDLMTGTAYNVPTPLTIRQDGYPEIRMTAHYDTKPFHPFAPYYSWRVNFWNHEHTAAWEVQQVHHRLFLSNTTAEVQRFEIHYGYNYFLFGRAWVARGFMLHASGGVIAPNPASEIRGKFLNTSDPGALDVTYRVSGVGAALSISRHLMLLRHLGVVADGGVLGGRAWVPVRDGHATVPNLGFHGHVGLSVAF